MAAGGTPINIVEIKREKERKMPEVAKKDRSKRRAVNSDSGAKSKSPLSGRKRVQTERSCSTNNAASKRQTGVKDISSPTDTAIRKLGEDTEDEDDDEEPVLTSRVSNGITKPITKNNAASTMHGMSVSTRPNVGDEVSMLRDSNSSVQASWESKMEALVDQRMKEMEASWKTQRTDVASVVSVPVNDDFLRENLRRFVAERVFPKFKFIFKETTLGQVVEMALTNGFITKPAESTMNEMKKYYSQAVRQSLDGCRANAQSVARKKYIGK